MRFRWQHWNYDDIMMLLTTTSCNQHDWWNLSTSLVMIFFILIIMKQRFHWILWYWFSLARWTQRLNAKYFRWNQWYSKIILCIGNCVSYLATESLRWQCPSSEQRYRYIIFDCVCYRFAGERLRWQLMIYSIPATMRYRRQRDSICILPVTKHWITMVLMWCSLTNQLYYS